MADQPQSNKPHRAGSSDTSKKKKLHANGFNAKAFAVANPGKLERTARRSHDVNEKRFHAPMVDRTPEEPAPVLVAVVGPKGTGKTTLIKSLVRRFTKHTLTEINGPVTVVSGKRRRLTFFECGTDLNSMIDIAKCADLILLMIDGNFGFEMETMEFLNILSPHGFPRILGVTTHLDLFKSISTMRASKKALKHRFWTEVYKGAKLFYLSGVMNGRYPDREVLNLARFISVMKFRPLKWRNEHPYLLADRVVDITHPSLIEENAKVDRTVTLYGYMRGSPMQAENAKVHVPGVGDLVVKEIERLPDPCPTPYAIKLEEAKAQGENAPKKRHRRLDEKMKTIYAPMSDVGGVMIDKDAVYIDVGTSSFSAGQEKGLGEKLVTNLQTSGRMLGDADTGIQLFSSSKALKNLSEDDEDAEEIDADLEDDLDGGELEEIDESHPDFGNTGRKSVREGKKAAVFNDEEQQEEYAFASSDSEIESGGEYDDDESSSALKWMDNFKPGNFKKRWDIGKLLYMDNISPEDVIKRWSGEEDEEAAEEEDIEAEDDFFKPKQTNQSAEPVAFLHYTNLAQWDDVAVVGSIADVFYREIRAVDGKDGDENGDDDEDEVYDDFEDLEAGEKSDDAEESDDAGDSKEPTGLKAVKSVEEQREENAKRKEQLRLQIEEDDDRELGAEDPEGEEGDTWYDTQKAKITKQLDINNAEYAQLDVATRDRIEGFRAGSYVRLVFSGIPCEFVEHFDPKYPVLVGGLLANEDRFGFSQVRIKRHRWHKRILKTNDPLVISLGWRRFQTCPIYTTSDSRTRNRMLKYTPEHMHCAATFYGPLVSPNTGFCAVQSVSDRDMTGGFRIAATGTVVEVDQEVEVVKKLKLVGYPYKIFKNTAFIKDMFNSSMEVARFEGAAIKTVSGIRGQIKRALAKPEGHFRATFEDKILMSDIIILRGWFPVQARRFYNPVTSLLLNDKATWKGMRLTGEVRAARGLSVPQQRDSAYGKIERATRRFNPLQVPKSLQAQLPFNSQIHRMKPQSKQTYMQKRAVVLDGQEKQMRDLMVKVATLRNEKDAKRQAKKDESRARLAAKQAKQDERRAEKRKEARQEYFARNNKKSKTT